MSLTINGATNTITAASGLTIAGDTVVTGALSPTSLTTGAGTFSGTVYAGYGGATPTTIYSTGYLQQAVATGGRALSFGSYRNASAALGEGFSIGYFTGAVWEEPFYFSRDSLVTNAAVSSLNLASGNPSLSIGSGALTAGAGSFSGTLSTTGVIGYATGAGGTVTQATNRTTGVTIDKQSGAITLVSAAGTASWQTFTVTNSTVAATDTITVNQKSGTDLNMIHVTAVADGSFNITFATTGGTTTEQPVFNFNVFKGVAA